MDEITRRPLRFEGHVLDATRRSLWAGGREVELRPKSFDVLQYLVENAGRLVTKDEIMQAVWPDVTVTDESLTRCVSDVRHAINDGEQNIIKTMPRRGYMFVAPVTREGLGTHLPAYALPQPSPGLVALIQRARQTISSRSYSRPGFAGALILLALAAAGFFYWRALSSVILPDRPSIAVLPFAVSSIDTAQSYLNEGISEDLTTNLSRFGELFVIAHQSAKNFNGRPFDAGQIGRELGVRYLLTGSIRRDASRVRITAQLVNAATARQLWAENYDRDIADYFAIQDEVTHRIVATLVAHVTKSEFERVLRKKPENIVAYEYVLRANALTNGRPNNPAVIAEAKALYEKALADDPRYARALQGLANVYFLTWAAENSPEYQQQPVLDRALALAQQAVDLDGASAEAHATLGWILIFQNRMKESVASFEHAFRVNPNFVDGRYGMLLSHVGRAPEAIDYMKRAMRFDPFHPPSYTYWLGKGYYFSGNYDEAIGLIRTGVERQPGVLPPRVLLAAVAARLGRHDEARAVAAEIMRMRPGFAIADWLKFIRVADPEYAQRLTDDLRKAGLPG
jgi:adenylate cyclase